MRDFIDRKCIVFDGLEENSFEHTKIHNQFKRLVEELLEFMIGDIGISQEVFLMCAKKGLTVNSDKMYWEQLISVENFLYFKNLMVKRNVQLEQEAYDLMMADLRKRDEENMRRAMAESASMSHRTVMAAQYNDMLRRKEDTEFECARQMSLAMEDERRRMLEMEDEELRRAIELSKLDFDKGRASQDPYSKIEFRPDEGRYDYGYLAMDSNAVLLSGRDQPQMLVDKGDGLNFQSGTRKWRNLDSTKDVNVHIQQQPVSQNQGGFQIQGQAKALNLQVGGMSEVIGGSAHGKIGGPKQGKVGSTLVERDYDEVPKNSILGWNKGSDLITDLTRQDKGNAGQVIKQEGSSMNRQVPVRSVDSSNLVKSKEIPSERTKPQDVKGFSGSRIESNSKEGNISVKNSSGLNQSKVNEDSKISNSGLENKARKIQTQDNSQSPASMNDSDGKLLHKLSNLSTSNKAPNDKGREPEIPSLISKSSNTQLPLSQLNQTNISNTTDKLNKRDQSNMTQTALKDPKTFTSVQSSKGLSTGQLNKETQIKEKNQSMLQGTELESDPSKPSTKTSQVTQKGKHSSQQVNPTTRQKSTVGVNPLKDPLDELFEYESKDSKARSEQINPMNLTVGKRQEPSKPLNPVKSKGSAEVDLKLNPIEDKARSDFTDKINLKERQPVTTSQEVSKSPVEKPPMESLENPQNLNPKSNPFFSKEDLGGKQRGFDPFSPYGLNRLTEKTGENPLEYEGKKVDYSVNFDKEAKAENEEDPMSKEYRNILLQHKNSLKDYREMVLKMKRDQREENIGGLFGKSGQELTEKERKRLEMRRELAEKLKKKNA